MRTQYICFISAESVTGFVWEIIAKNIVVTIAILFIFSIPNNIAILRPIPSNRQHLSNDDWRIRGTRMWANAQRDGRPAEHRWRPLFNAAKFGWRPLRPLPRRETRWNLQLCLKLLDGSQPLVGRRSPYCGDMWRTYRCLTSFFSDCRYVS